MEKFSLWREENLAASCLRTKVWLSGYDGGMPKGNNNQE